MAKLGYTFYAKDWRSNMAVSDLTLQEKGFYRELIDECFLKNSSTIHINERTFCRLHGINSRTFTKVLHKLHESLLIVLENFDETIIHIPSTSKRLDKITTASGGGKGKVKSSAKEKEKEKDKVNIKETVFSFDDFMKVYPNRTKLKDARIKYDKLSEAKRELIKNTVNNFVNNKPFESYNHPAPTAYINQERWNDEIGKPRSKSSSFKMDKF